MTDGEAFVADLVRLGVSRVKQPWTPGNTQDPQGVSKWTAELLLPRLELTTKTALDVYQALVNRHLPAMAHELSTCQLLPGRIAGSIAPVDPELSFVRHPRFPFRFRWRIEPLPFGSPNEARWEVQCSNEQDDNDDWPSRMAQLRALRGDLAECIRLFSHFGEPAVSSPTPACSLALELLRRDLEEFEWVAGPARYDLDGCCGRPRYI